MPSPRDGEFQIKPCNIMGQFNVQRFRQWSPEDAANWYLVKEDNTKKPYAMYPCMGRKHINFNGTNQLIFGSEPRGLFKTIKYGYVVVGDTIFRINENYEIVNISGLTKIATSANIYFTYLVVNDIVFACFTDQQRVYIYQENTGTFNAITDGNCPGGTSAPGNTQKPGFIATFGNRITVSVLESSEFILSRINLLPKTGAFNPATCFTNDVTPQVFAREEGIIRQMGVLNNTLYIFTDYETGVWSNIPAVFSGTGVTFPWKKNSTYNWNFGIANPTSLDINFGYMVFLARNYEGLLTFMVSSGGQPEPINNKAISTLLQRYSNALGNNSPFLVPNSNGFLYQYEDVISYRMSGGDFINYGILDQESNANSIEFNFETKTWHRCIEDNGNRNRIQLHLFYNNLHLVTVVGDGTVYNMSGEFYVNEIRNTAQENQQADDAYTQLPFRYERITPIIFEDDYAEFETEYVQIDFVFGESFINYSEGPFDNAQFIIDEVNTIAGNPQFMIDEQASAGGDPVYIIDEEGNFPTLADSDFYNDEFNPHISLYWSDDGGISFESADNREFSRQGQYSWRMRWYQLGQSRNRVYKLIAVSKVPIVVLGAVMNVRRSSGGAN